MLGRERIEDHDTIAFVLTPRHDVEPKTHAGEQVRHFKVRAWVSENDHELWNLGFYALTKAGRKQLETEVSKWSACRRRQPRVTTDIAGRAVFRNVLPAPR